jgi:hypothetical protein
MHLTEARRLLAPSRIESLGRLAKCSTDPAFKWLHLFISHTNAATLNSSKIIKDGLWSVTFHIDLRHKIAMRVVQEFAYVCDGRTRASILPIVFQPMSSSPENGDPEDQLFWVIESHDPQFTPDMLVAELSTEILKQITSWPPKIKDSSI